MFDKLMLVFTAIALAYSMYVFYDREVLEQKLEDAKVEAVVQKLDAKIEQFESNQTIIFESDKRRPYVEANNSIGKHTISFGVIRMQ